MTTQTKLLTPEKAVAILSKQGSTVSLEEATAILDFMYLLADIYLYDLQEA